MSSKPSSTLTRIILYPLLNDAKVRLLLGAFVKEVHGLKGIKLSNYISSRSLLNLFFFVTLNLKHNKFREKNRERRNLLDAPQPGALGTTDNTVCCSVSFGVSPWQGGTPTVEALRRSMVLNCTQSGHVQKG